MASNQLHYVDYNLKKCYEHDLNWALIPQGLKEICRFFAKGLKQRESSILLGLIVLTSFCMGHTYVNVQNAFWKEPVIVWIASVISTGTLNGKGHILTQEENDIVLDNNSTPLQNPQGINKIFAQIVTCPARIVSFTILNSKSFFRRHNVEGISGRRLMERVADEIDAIGVGRIEIIAVQGNNSKVYFYHKDPPPEEQENKIQFIKKLAAVGISMPRYISNYDVDTAESKKHHEDYSNKRDAQPTTPRKKPRTEDHTD